MGLAKNQAHESKGKRGRRGSVNNKERLDAFGSSRGGGAADWGGCDCGLLQAAIVGITALGGAVTIGMSRDGGAHSMTLMLDGERKSLWFNGDADLDEELRGVIAKLEVMQ